MFDIYTCDIMLFPMAHNVQDSQRSGIKGDNVPFLKNSLMDKEWWKNEVIGPVGDFTWLEFGVSFKALKPEKTCMSLIQKVLFQKKW